MKGTAKPVIIFVLILVFGFAVQFTASQATAADCAKTYANFGKAFMEKYCTNCHTSAKKGKFGRRGAPAGYDFDSVDGIKKEKTEIIEWVNVKKKMPPKAPVSDQEQADLKTWLDCEYK